MSRKPDEKMTLGRALCTPFIFLINVGKGFSLVRLLIAWALLLVIPYAYVWVCGLVFDLWLKMYGAVIFIFASMIAFWVINIIIAILFTVGYSKGKR